MDKMPDKKPGENVSRMIQRVLGCPMRMPGIKMTGSIKDESSGQPANPGLA